MTTSRRVASEHRDLPVEIGLDALSDGLDHFIEERVRELRGQQQ